MLLKIKSIESGCLLLDGDIMLCPDDEVEPGIYDHTGIRYQEVYDPDDPNELIGFGMVV